MPRRVRRLPVEVRGFAVSARTAEVHLRHAPHAIGLTRTTQQGALNILAGRRPELCVECFPPPPPRQPRSSTRA